jgi:His-Xaa-Ser system protein HxsD
MNSVPSFDNGTAGLHIDESIYARDAVLRTSYWFTDRCYFFISRPAQGTLLVTMRLKESRPTLEKPNPDVLQTVVGEFQNALLDQQLRIDIEKQTRAVRELLVAKAFSEAGELDDLPPGDFRDPVDLLVGK